jgi:hypothetical protein
MHTHTTHAHANHEEEQAEKTNEDPRRPKVGGGGEGAAREACATDSHARSYPSNGELDYLLLRTTTGKKRELRERSGRRRPRRSSGGVRVGQMRAQLPIQWRALWRPWAGVVAAAFAETEESGESSGDADVLDHISVATHPMASCSRRTTNCHAKYTTTAQRKTEGESRARGIDTTRSGGLIMQAATCHKQRASTTIRISCV